MNRTQWSLEEINHLRKSFSSGKKIKIIANELNRSNMGISKALQRFKIRLSPLPTSDSKAVSAPKKITKTRIRETQKRFHDDWISINRLVRWMQEEGFKAYAIDKDKKKFFLTGQILTPGQFLLHCNRYRLNNYLPAFRVKGITNE